MAALKGTSRLRQKVEVCEQSMLATPFRYILAVIAVMFDLEQAGEVNMMPTSTKLRALRRVKVSGDPDPGADHTHGLFVGSAELMWRRLPKS
jgi:hypothetical protein